MPASRLSRSAAMMSRPSGQRLQRPEQPFPAREECAGAPQDSTTQEILKAWGETLPKDSPVLKTEGLDNVYIISPAIHDHSHSHEDMGRVFDRAGGDRLHFRYGDPFDSRPCYSDDEDLSGQQEEFDEKFTRSCIAALSNLIARRVSRAMIDLIGIEPNPGPSRAQKKKKNTTVKKASTQNRMGQKSRAETRLGSSLRVIGGRMTSLVQANRGLASMRAYQNVLCNPFDNVPVRLGGENMQPSGLATLSCRGIIALTTGSLSAVFYPWATQPLVITSSVSSSGPYTYTASGLLFPGGPSLAAIAAEGRVVAAGIRVTSIDNSNNNQGVITIGCLPRNQVNPNLLGTDADGLPWTATTAATQAAPQFYNYLQTESYPLRNGCSGFWKPEDPLDFTFREIPILNITGAASSPYGLDLTPCVVVGIQGANTTAQILVELISHIEYTVSAGTTGVVDTGYGDMTEQQIIDVNRGTFMGKINSVIEGVTGGFLDAASTVASSYIGPKGMKLLTDGSSALASSASSYFSNTNRM
jgi:hypothetical protein